MDNLEDIIGIKDLPNQQDFLDVLKLDKAIIYLLVDWSGQERQSRKVVFQTLNELDKHGTPVFKINCSDQTKKYIVDWLIEQRQNIKDFYYGGFGETLLLEKRKSY